MSRVSLFHPELFFRLSVILATALFVFAAGAEKPARNWDMIGYVAASLHSDGYSGKELQEKTYAIVRNDAGADTFNDLVKGDYRATVFTDPKSLEQHLPGYSIRVVYIGSMKILHYFGLDYAKSTYVASAAFASLSVLILGIIFGEMKIPIVALPFIAVSCGVVEVAGMSAPDAAACFFSLLAVYSMTKSAAAASMIAVILPSVRTDFILLSLLITAYLFAVSRRWIPIAALAGAAGGYLLINKLCGNYGWLNVFNFTLIKLTPYPADLVPSRHLMDYIKPYAVCIYGLTRSVHFFLYAFGICYAYAAYSKVRGRIALSGIHKSTVAFLIIPGCFAVAHMLLFPIYLPRFFVFSACTIAIWLTNRILQCGDCDFFDYGVMR